MGEGRARPRDFIAHVLVPLLIGTAVYILWRGRGIRLFDWLGAAGLNPAIAAAREGAASVRVPRALLFTLPDAMWAYAFGAALGLVWLGGARLSRAIWLGAAGTIACAIELGQAASVIPGTFDRLDLIAIGGGFAAGALFAPYRAGAAVSRRRAPAT
jgi:hypothetical protein